MATKLTQASGVAVEECVSGSLDLFSTPFQETIIDNCYFTEIDPSTPLADSGNSIKFSIPSSQDFVDLAQSVVVLKVKITTSAGNDLPPFTWTDAQGGPPAVPAAGTSVGFIQLPLTSLFSSVNFILNEQTLSDSFSTYPYVSYFQTVLNFSKDARDSRLQLLGFYEDSNPNVTRADPGAVSSGYKERAAATASSHVATYLGPVFHSLFSQNRFLIPLMPFSLEWIKASPLFALKGNASGTFIYKITSMKMLIRKVKILPSYKLDIEAKLEKQAAIYPIRHSYCKPFFIDAGDKQASFENIFQGKSIPAVCAVALVEQTNYRGTLGTSPFQFAHHSVSSLKISFDSFSYPTPTPFQPNFDSTTEGDWTRSYLSLFDGGNLKVDHGLMINYSKYKNNGFTIWVFDFGRETTLANDHVSTKRGGSARLDISFAPTSNNNALTLLLYVESDELLEVDSNRKVHRGYHL